MVNYTLSSYKNTDQSESSIPEKCITQAYEKILKASSALNSISEMDFIRSYSFCVFTPRDAI